MRVLAGGVVIAGAILIVRLAWFQLWLHEPLQYDYQVRGSGELLDTTRGAIYSADGVLLARDVAVFDLSVHYSSLEDDPQTAPDLWDKARRLRAQARARARAKRGGDAAEPARDWKAAAAGVTGVGTGELLTRADAIYRRVDQTWQAVNRRTNGRIKNLRIVEQQQYHAVARDIPKEVAVLVLTSPERFPGLKVTTRSQRVYHQGALAPHVVGRCGRISPEGWRDLAAGNRTWATSRPVWDIDRLYLPDDMIGVTGMERACEDLLRGCRGHREEHLFFHTLRVERRATTTPPQPGADVHLTLRADFQQAAGEALQWAVAQPELSFKKGSLVIMDVRSGAILAAATWPSYNLETFDRDCERLIAEDEGLSMIERRTPLLFRPTQAALPPGSVFKIFTTIAALESGRITPQTTFRCTGSEQFLNRQFHCTGIHGNTDLLRAIEKSCNIYFYNVAVLCSAKDLSEWGRRFGLAMPTGVELSERIGALPEPTSLFERLNTAIGQGSVLCTPLQVVRSCAAIANGGRLVQPHFFARAMSADGKLLKAGEPQVSYVQVQPATLRVVREGMRRAVQTGTAANTRLRRFDAAGKTGTAELGEGRPNHCWFAGFAPFDNPKVAFVVVSEYSGGHGGTAAAPIMDKALETVWPEVERMP